MVARYVRTRALSTSMEKELVKAYQETDESVMDLAKRFGISPAGVTRTAKRWKVPLRNNKKTSYWDQP